MVMSVFWFLIMTMTAVWVVEAALANHPSVAALRVVVPDTVIVAPLALAMGLLGVGVLFDCVWPLRIAATVQAAVYAGLAGSAWAGGQTFVAMLSIAAVQLTVWWVVLGLDRPWEGKFDD